MSVTKPLRDRYRFRGLGRGCCRAEGVELGLWNVTAERFLKIIFQITAGDCVAGTQQAWLDSVWAQLLREPAVGDYFTLDGPRSPNDRNAPTECTTRCVKALWRGCQATLSCTLLAPPLAWTVHTSSHPSVNAGIGALGCAEVNFGGDDFA
jgi:hypothetical protein